MLISKLIGLYSPPLERRRSPHLSSSEESKQRLLQTLNHSAMRLDPTLALVMILLTMMLGATSASAFWGYTLGRKALGGITQPDIRPNQVNSSDTGDDGRGDIRLKSEQEILSQVKAQMNGEPPPQLTENLQSSVNDGAPQFNSATAESRDEAASSSTGTSFISYSSTFPLMTEDSDVVLAIHSVQRQEDVLRINVSLQNAGENPVEFLYSLMDVLSEQGQPLTASTDGLPQTLPPTGEAFNGSIAVPLVLINRSESLSLRLADYPKQQVELSISGIPVAR